MNGEKVKFCVCLVGRGFGGGDLYLFSYVDEVKEVFNSFPLPISLNEYVFLVNLLTTSEYKPFCPVWDKFIRLLSEKGLLEAVKQLVGSQEKWAKSVLNCMRKVYCDNEASHISKEFVKGGVGYPIFLTPLPPTVETIGRGVPKKYIIIQPTESKAFKDVLRHELGHFFGLKHCREKSCIMHVGGLRCTVGGERGKEFCKKCLRKLGR